MDTTVADPLLGALIDGRYRVRSRVARGGMATVYTAVDERLERTVALKIIHPTQAHDRRFLERFIDEAKTIARLTHPNVVAVYDQGTHHALPYLVMEYVRGRTLRALLADRHRLQPPEALAIMEQMLAAIAAAHRAGLVHRDVKPENVLVAEAPGSSENSIVDGVVKVADFGLARAVERSADDGGSQLLATAAYVAPELVTSGHADARTDVYSAGIVLFEMLTGRVPYDGGRPVDVAWQHVQNDVPPPSRYVPTLPPTLDELVVRATRRDPGGRPTDAGAMLAEVQAAREDVGLAVTTRVAPLAAPTVGLPRVDPVPVTYDGGSYEGPDRPGWARLPEPRRRTRRAEAAAAGGFWSRIVGQPRGRLALASALMTLGVLAAVGGWYFGIGRYTQAPSLLDKPSQAAQAEARKAGFTVRFGAPKYSEKKARDTVLEQQPPPNARIVSGGTITLILSLGPERIKIPDVAGKQATDALAELTGLKLVPERVDKFDDIILKDSVIRTDPPAGGTVSPGTKITVEVSKGRAPINIPNLIGQQVADAQTALTKLKLKYTVTEKDSDKPKGEVIGQDPGEGASAEPGQNINLTVSKGPPEADIVSFVGQPVQQAKQQLEALGFVVVVSGNQNGTVFIQTPNSGRAARGTQITLYAL